MRFVREIFDEIHGFIDLTELEAKIIQNCAFSRLHRVHQLGPAYIVYASATHTRFAHSIGTLRIADRLYTAAVEDQSDDERQLVRLAGLLHDIGHLPFSHALSSEHETLGIRVLKNYFENELSGYLEALTRILMREDRLSVIISGEVDADRMDYLLRDSHHLGLPYRGVDLERVIRHARLARYERRWVLAFTTGAEVAVESLILTRLELFRRVYHHKHVTGLEALLSKIYNVMLQENLIPTPLEIIENGDWCGFDDCFLIETLKTLAKRENWLGEASKAFLRGEIPVMVAELFIPLNTVEEVVNNIREAAACRVPEEWILPYLPKLVPIKDPDNLLIVKDNALYKLPEAQESLLHLVKSFKISPLRIYTKSEFVAKLRECLNDVLRTLNPESSGI
ncbi:MAG: HD domain-containing protein [Infirmifilum sp.]